jgi:hypothetical protein
MRLALVVMLTALLTGCATSARGPLFEATTPAATGKCALYVYYISGDIERSPPLLIDDEIAGNGGRMELGGYLRREMSCGPHFIALGYRSSFFGAGSPCGYKLTFGNLQASRNETKNSYCAGKSLVLIDGSTAFLKVTQERRMDPSINLIRKTQWWSFVSVDPATALSELKSMRASD